jgi:SWI/SNF-related matrix-associated actin-dependent regulator of chromatin subfamily A member 5
LFSLGKTLQIIAFLSYLKYERGISGPHLIVVPLSVMGAWMAEFKRWSPGMRVVRYHGPLGERRRLQNEDAAFGNFDCILTTYEVVVGDEDFFRYKQIWQYIIVDESVQTGNRQLRDAC